MQFTSQSQLIYRKDIHLHYMDMKNSMNCPHKKLYNEKVSYFHNFQSNNPIWPSEIFTELFGIVIATLQNY